ncbi:MAG: hypothetical protein JSS82_14225 [Bacteroidetes bacterium]|nr:hypothetical protein [Bacteroidota bacterium]
MRTKLIIGLLLLCLTCGCKVSWVPDHDAGLETQIVNGAKMTDRLYLEMLDKEKTERMYGNFSKSYIDIETEIYSIELKNKIRKNNTELLKITKNLEDHFKTYKQEHKQKEVLSNAEIKIYMADMQGFWEPLLLAEKGLNTK